MLLTAPFMTLAAFTLRLLLLILILRFLEKEKVSQSVMSNVNDNVVTFVIS